MTPDLDVSAALEAAERRITLQEGEQVRIEVSPDGLITLQAVNGHIQIVSYITPLLNWHGEECELREVERHD